MAGFLDFLFNRNQTPQPQPTQSHFMSRFGSFLSKGVGETEKVANQFIVQPAMQGVVRTGINVANIGRRVIGEAPITSYTPNARQQNILGKQPVTGSFAARGRQFPGVGHLPGAAQAGLGAVLTYLDINPVAGMGESKAADVIDKLSTANTAAGVTKILKGAKIGLDNTTTKDVASKIAATSNKSQIRNILKNAPNNLTGPQANGLKGAVRDLYQFYQTQGKYTGTIKDVVNQANGRIQNGTRLSQALGEAINRALPNMADRIALRDLMDGGVKASEVSPKVRSVAAHLAPIQDQGLKIRQASGQVDPLENYFTRLAKGSLKTPEGKVYMAGKGGVKLPLLNQRINSLSDVFSTGSRFSTGRQIFKFVAKDGTTRYGTMDSAGLHLGSGGKIVDKSGKVYQQLNATAKEIEQSKVMQYEKDAGKIAETYHGDTAALKVRQDAITAIKNNPDFQVKTLDQAPDGWMPIKNVKELDGYAAPPDVARTIEKNLGQATPSNALGQFYDKATRMITNTIVANPLFHGQNQLIQSLIAAGKIPLENGSPSAAAGMGKFMSTLEDTLRNPATYEQWTRDYLDHGGHYPTYGTEVKGDLYKAFDKVGWGNLTKLSPQTMQGIERSFRVAGYRAAVEAGMAPKAAIANIDHYLGDAESLGKTANRTLLFGHYLKTMGGALTGAVTHPVQELGATANAVTLAAVYAGLNYGWQQVTGNPNASVRVPGELGVAQQIAKAPGQVQQGEMPSIVRNHLNPIASLGVQEATNRDFTRPLAGPAAQQNQLEGGPTSRGALAVRTLLGPAQTVQNIMSQKQSTPEAVFSYLTGLYTPHTAGHQAVSAGSALSFLNQPGAQAGNGEAASQAFYKALDSAWGTLNPTDQKQLADYLARQKDAQGNTIQESPSDRIKNAQMLFGNDNLRQAVQQVQQASGQHDPMWDLSPSKLKTFIEYQKQYTGDTDKKVLLLQNPWIQQVTDARNKFFAQLPQSKSVANPQTPAYPKIDAQTQALMNKAATTTDGNLKVQIYANPKVQQAFQAIDQYTANMRQVEGAPALKTSPVASPQIQQAMSFYNSLPSRTGARTAWINANPQLYAQMQDYLMQTDTYSLAHNAAVAQFKGQDLNQSALKAAYNLAKYDIAKQGNQYVLNPQLAYQQSRSAKASTSSNKELSYLKSRLKSKATSLRKKSVSTGRVLTPKLSTSTRNPLLSKAKSKSLKVGKLTLK